VTGAAGEISCPASGRVLASTDTIETMKKSSVILLLLACAIAPLSSCVPLAVGAAAGYVAHEEGYRVRNPITKSE
jgi:hypothetical protein